MRMRESESGTIAVRTWFVVLTHVIRQPASSTSGHRARGGDHIEETDPCSEGGEPPVAESKRGTQKSVAGGRRWLGGAPYEGSLR